MTHPLSTSPIDFRTLNAAICHHLYATDPDKLCHVDDMGESLAGDSAVLVAEAAVADKLPGGLFGNASIGFDAGFHMGVRVAAAVLSSPLNPNITELQAAIEEARGNLKSRNAEAA